MVFRLAPVLEKRSYVSMPPPGNTACLLTCVYITFRELVIFFLGRAGRYHNSNGTFINNVHNKTRPEDAPRAPQITLTRRPEPTNGTRGVRPSQLRPNRATAPAQRPLSRTAAYTRPGPLSLASDAPSRRIAGELERFPVLRRNVHRLKTKTGVQQGRKLRQFENIVRHTPAR